MKKIFSLFVALTAMVAVNAADYYLVGGFCGWNTGNAVKFTEVSAERRRLRQKFRRRLFRLSLKAIRP